MNLHIDAAIRGRVPLRRFTSVASLMVLAFIASPAAADEPAPPTESAKPVELTVPGQPATSAPDPVPPPSTRFTADPVADTGIVALGLTFSLLSAAILGTGEIRPQQIRPSFTDSSLLGIDRPALRQSIDKNASSFSNFGLYAAVAFAVGDTVADVFREGKSAALTDFVMYAEAISITQGLTNIAKIAFRRPRPIAYIDRKAYLDAGGDPLTYDNASTDSALSFFSGHASAVASIASAATYISFVRSPHGIRPWLTLAGSVALTSFVSYERVRAGAHFPTDVIAGSLVGAGIGALVVHLHREDAGQRPVWVGFNPASGGGTLTAGGIF